MDGTALDIDVTQPSADAPPERGTFIVEHFADFNRNGIRVRERGSAGFESTITSTDPDCFVNSAFNDAVCQPFPTSGSIFGGLGDDNIDIGGSNTDCAAAAAVPFEVALRDGNDRLTARFNCGNQGSPAGINRLHPRFLIVRGGGGSDEIIGGRLDDSLFGDAGLGDELRGGDGNDTLRDSDHADMSGGAGNDRLEAPGDGGRVGGPGDDTLVGGTSLSGGSGTDTLTGDGSGETLDGGSGADVIDGGTNTDASPSDGECEERTPPEFLGQPAPGAEPFTVCGFRDTVSYQSRTVPVTVTLDGVANDGEAGEGDQLLNVEVVRGGAGGDSITGSARADRLEGNDGQDTLLGADGPDELVGGPGTDVLNGGLGDDTINSRDGIPESVNCGGGTDHLIADSQDTVVLVGARRTPSCESVEASPVDDGRPGLILGRSIAIGRDRSVALRLHCPRNARVTCRGRLRLVDAVRPSRTLAAARYAVRRRRTGTVRLRPSRRAASRMRASRAVVARTRERGVSRKGPRRHVVRLSVRRAR